MRPGVLAGVVTAVLLVAGAARAVTVEEEVQKLSDQAVDAYKAGDYQRAVQLLTRAYAIRPLTPLLYNLAKAYDKLGDADNAYENYKKYAESGEADAKLEAKARARMTFFEPQLKPKKPPEPEPLPTTTRPEPAGPTPEELAAEEDARRRRLKLVALFGGAGVAALGAALVIAGGALYASAASKHELYGMTRDEAEKRALRDQAQSTGTTSTALYAVGGVLFGIGAAAVVMAFVLPQLQPAAGAESGGSEEKPAEPEVSFVPYLGPDGLGAGATWRF